MYPQTHLDKLLTLPGTILPAENISHYISAILDPSATHLPRLHCRPLNKTRYHALLQDGQEAAHSIDFFSALNLRECVHLLPRPSAPAAAPSPLSKELPRWDLRYPLRPASLSRGSRHPLLQHLNHRPLARLPHPQTRPTAQPGTLSSIRTQSPRHGLHYGPLRQRRRRLSRRPPRTHPPAPPPRRRHDVRHGLNLRRPRPNLLRRLGRAHLRGGLLLRGGRRREL